MIPPPVFIPFFSLSYSGGTPKSKGIATVIWRYSWTPLNATLRSRTNTSPPLITTASSTLSQRISRLRQNPCKFTLLVVSTPFVAEIVKIEGMHRPCSWTVGKGERSGRRDSLSNDWKRCGRLGIAVTVPSQPNIVMTWSSSFVLLSPSGKALTPRSRAIWGKGKTQYNAITQDTVI